MNPTFIAMNLKEGEIIRITTPEAMGVIGKVNKIDLHNDGLILEEIAEVELLSQIDNVVPYKKAYFTISEVKYIFSFDLTKKPTEQNGTNDS